MNRADRCTRLDLHNVPVTAFRDGSTKCRWCGRTADEITAQTFAGLVE